MAGLALDDILSQLHDLPPAERNRLIQEAYKATENFLFIPNPGQQTLAYDCPATIMLYGGAAGGGKTSLLLGTAVNNHHRSLILRREAAELDGLISDSHTLLHDHGKYNASDKEWRWNTHSLKFGGCKEPEDWRKYAGRARDFIGLDEAAEFLESQVASLMAWLRSTDPTQRCRLILASNPPRTSDGDWVFKWFAPWLDDNDPNPALPGEIRYAITVDKEIRWVDSPTPVQIEGETYTPISYTFIPSSLDDNPFLSRTNYRQRLENMPGPLRAQLLKGDFSAGKEDREFQVIPTEWIVAAQQRWLHMPPPGANMSAIALDPAGGGTDPALMAWRYGGWYAPLLEVQGAVTADGSLAAARIIQHRRDGCPVIVDAGGGYGGGVKLRLMDNDIKPVMFNGTEASTARTVDRTLEFYNKRAEAYWKFREALDPSQEFGSPISLPPDTALKAELAAPLFDLRRNGIILEDKDDIRKRLGRSPNRADAVVMCWSEGDKALMRRMRNRHTRQLQTQVDDRYDHLRMRR